LRGLERPAGFAADAYVCRNVARIDPVTESRISAQWQKENRDADAVAGCPLLKDQRTKFRLDPRFENAPQEVCAPWQLMPQSMSR
jgi:hypothetical protein